MVLAEETFLSPQERPLFSTSFIGPRPVYGSPYSDGAVSGRIGYILPHPTDPNTVYIAAAGGGVWRTSDGGNTWTPLTDNLPTLSSGALAFAPNDPNVIYYGTGELNYCDWSCLPGEGLFKSTDGGATWTQIATASEVGEYIDQIWVRPDNPDVIFIASDIGLVRSTDGGNTWSLVITTNNVNSIAVRSDNPYVMFAGVYGAGVYKSTDGGSTWSQITSLPTSGIRRVEVAISPSNPDVVYASFSDIYWNLRGLYKSTDGGATWTQLSGAPNYLSSYGDYGHVVSVHPTGPDTVFVGGFYVYRSLDGGSSWTDITDRGSNGRVHHNVHHMAWGADGALYVASDGGIWRSYDLGNSWENLNADLGITQFYSIVPHPTNPDLVVGGTHSNGTVGWHISWGDDWQYLRGWHGGQAVWIPNQPDSLIATDTFLSRLTLHEWNGSSFLYRDSLSNPWSGESVCWACSPIVGDPSGSTPTLFVGTQRIWVSYDGGYTWSQLTGIQTYDYLRSIAVSNSLDTIYFGTSNALFRVSFDGGATWTTRGFPPPLHGWEDIPDVVINPTNGAEVYTILRKGSGPRILRSSDAGLNWVDITGDFPALWPRALAVDFTKTPPAVFVGTSRGLYYSLNQSNYVRFPGIPATMVYDLRIDATGQYLYVATHGRGVWRINLTSTHTTERSDEKERAFTLFQNDIIAHVNLTVYTPDGRKVAGLTPGDRKTLKRGIYLIRWRGGMEKIVIRW